MSDLRPPIASALTAFGVDAVVTLPGEDAVETRAIWLAPRAVEVPVGSNHQRVEARRVLSIPISTVPAVPRGTIISAPEAEGQVAQDWKVDAHEHVDYDHHRVVVAPTA